MHFFLMFLCFSINNKNNYATVWNRIICLVNKQKICRLFHHPHCDVHDWRGVCIPGYITDPGIRISPLVEVGVHESVSPDPSVSSPGMGSGILLLLESLEASTILAHLFKYLVQC